MVSISQHYRLKKPCSNCPFLKHGAVELAHGRLQGIISGLMEDDHSSFPCHKIVHSQIGGVWDESGVYNSSGNESMCAGAVAYLMKVGRPTVGMRLAFVTRAISPDQWNDAYQNVIDPI